jgi:hypothetical protein
MNFPTSPTAGQTYSYGGSIWIYNGTSWRIMVNDKENMIYLANNFGGL